MKDHVGRFTDRPAHTPGGQVARDGQGAPSAAVESLQHGMRKQRQCARFRRSIGIRTHILQNQLDQPWLKLPAAAPGRFMHRLAQLGCVHRPDIFLLAGQRVTQRPVCGAAGIEVGSQRQHHAGLASRLRGGGQQVIHKRLPLAFLPAQREQLFELVYHQQQVRGKPSGGVWPAFPPAQELLCKQVQGTPVASQVVDQAGPGKQRGPVLGQAGGQGLQRAVGGGEAVDAPAGK